jgi:hypothetical protein
MPSTMLSGSPPGARYFNRLTALLQTAVEGSHAGVRLLI